MSAKIMGRRDGVPRRCVVLYKDEDPRYVWVKITHPSGDEQITRVRKDRIEQGAQE